MAGLAGAVWDWRAGRGGFARLDMPDELPSRVVASIAFVGRTGGQVKALAGFKKGRHTLPDAANAVTNAFLGKICDGELAAEAEKLFQAVRTGLGDRKSTRLNSSHSDLSRMPSSA